MRQLSNRRKSKAHKQQSALRPLRPKTLSLSTLNQLSQDIPYSNTFHVALRQIDWHTYPASVLLDLLNQKRFIQRIVQAQWGNTSFVFHMETVQMDVGH